MDARQVVNQWLADQGKRDAGNLSAEDYANLRTLLAPHRGFGVFWSMIAFERQLTQELLNNADLLSEDGRQEALRYQGRIMAIDTIHDLIVSIADPVSEAAETGRITEGVNFNG